MLTLVTARHPQAPRFWVYGVKIRAYLPLLQYGLGMG